MVQQRAQRLGIRYLPLHRRIVRSCRSRSASPDHEESSSLTQAKELAPFKCQIAGFVLRWVGDKFLMELGDLLDDAHRAAFDLGVC